MTKKEVTELSVEELFEKLDSSKDGISDEESRIRLSKLGENALKKEGSSGFRIFFNQFKSSLIYLLILAAALSFVLKDFTDGFVISIILLINAFLGFLQEYRSEKAVERLSKLISKKILTIRGGKVLLIDEKQLVVGDVVVVREGDIVPADLRIFESEDLSVNESQLTGESVPVAKGVSKTEISFSFLLFAGSVIEKGDGKGIVFATANDTELGKIAKLSATTKKSTQYEKSLRDFSNYLMRIILLTLVVVFVAKVLITNDFNHISTLFLFVIALAITVIPEALPVVAIVTLSEGALKLAKQHVIVKRLSSLEDLGNVNLLCTDKTGTLTENKLSIQSLISDDPELFQKLAVASTEDLGVKKKKFQSSYDSAFLNFIPKEIQDEAKHLKQLNDLPFDPADRRRRVVLEDSFKKTHYLVVVGSAETLLDLSDTGKKMQYLKSIKEDGEQGIRHLAIAYKEIKYTGRDFDILKHEDNLKFLGYAQLVDPLRSTAKQTVELAQKLGINIKILTGDSKEVAEYVGKKIGLLTEKDKVYTGEDLENLSESDLKKVVEDCSVFARVTPEQKYEIIKLLKTNHVVGYQGDGINDAPSLKLADVAIAVNTATDVAIDSSDIVLLKNDLEVIVKGINYGREIFVNINKYIKHTMVGNLGSFFSLALLYLISAELPLLPIQLLIGNLIQDIPLISVYSDNVDIDEVKKPERYNIHSVMLISLFLGAFSTIFYFIYFAFVGFKTNMQTETNLFLFLTFTQLVIIFSVRNKANLWIGKKPSWQVVGSVLSFFVISGLIVYITPLASLFSFSPLPLYTLGIILISTIVYILLLDYIKVLYFKLIQNH